MTDILKKLDNWENVYPEDYDKPDGHLYVEAADEIERLRAEVKRARVEGMRTALHIAEEIERQNGPLSRRGFNEKYRLGLQSAGNAMAGAIRALIDKEVRND